MNRLLFVLVASASALQLANLRNPDPLALEHKAVETSDDTDEAFVTSDENEEGPLDLEEDLRPSHELPQKFDTMWEAEGQFNAANQGTALTGGASFTVPHGDGVKLVVGIPMMANEQDIRNAHMNTWMKGDGVCNRDSFATQSCHIFPVFLYGNSSESMLKAKETEFGLSLQVPDPEANYDGYDAPEHHIKNLGSHGADALKNLRGKTHEWFKHAAASYPKATHIAKMDSDTYPHMAAVLHDLATGPEKNLYWGTSMAGDQCNGSFMQGAFYILSASLQPCRQRQLDEMLPDFFGESHGWNRNEDGLFGQSLKEAVESGKCPQPTCMNVRNRHRYVHPV